MLWRDVCEAQNVDFFVDLSGVSGIVRLHESETTPASVFRVGGPRSIHVSGSSRPRLPFWVAPMSHKLEDEVWKLKIPPAWKYVALALASHVNRKDTHGLRGICWPSISRLSAVTGYSRTTVWRTINQLRPCGLVGTTHRNGRQAFLLNLEDEVLKKLPKPKTTKPRRRSRWSQNVLFGDKRDVALRDIGGESV